MFLEKHGRVTPFTRGQKEQTPAGPAPHGIHLYRCRCCSLDHRGWPRETPPWYAEMELTHQELIAHLHGELHKRRSADGRLEEYIRKNDANMEAQYCMRVLRPWPPLRPFARPWPTHLSSRRMAATRSLHGCGHEACRGTALKINNICRTAGQVSSPCSGGAMV